MVFSHKELHFLVPPYNHNHNHNHNHPLLLFLLLLLLPNLNPPNTQSKLRGLLPIGKM
jgi:hypothetical protein